MLAQKAVDVGVDDHHGRDARAGRGAHHRAERAVPGLNLVLSTGAYLEGAPWTAPVRDLTEEPDDRAHGQEPDRGLRSFEGTGIRAGVIKVASNKPQLTDGRRRTPRGGPGQQEAHVPICSTPAPAAGSRCSTRASTARGLNAGPTTATWRPSSAGTAARSRRKPATWPTSARRAAPSTSDNFDFEFDTPFPRRLYLINKVDQSGYGDASSTALTQFGVRRSRPAPGTRRKSQHPETGARTYAYCLTHATPMLMSAGVSLTRQPLPDRQPTAALSRRSTLARASRIGIDSVPAAGRSGHLGARGVPGGTFLPTSKCWSFGEGMRTWKAESVHV